MKKILAFNDYFIPAVKCGGPVTSINNAVKALKGKFQFYIEAANHDFGDNTPFPGIGDDWYDVNGAKVRYHKDGELDFNYKATEAFIKEVNPDIMWFSGLLVPNKIHNAIRVGAKLNIPVVISPRGEASADRMALKAYKKIPYAFLVTVLGIYKKKNVFFHATSDDEIEGLVKYFHIDRNRITKVPNIGVVPMERAPYKKECGFLKLVFISRIHEVKNLDFAIDVLNSLHCNVVFDIYGPIESPDYWAKCQALISNSPSNVTINYCGKVDPSNVGPIYQKYDFFFFPTINENYGHVIAESLANGLPVVLSKGTTPWDDLDNVAGRVCDLPNKTQFVKVLSELAELDDTQYNDLVDSTNKYYSDKLSETRAIEGHACMFENFIRTLNND